MQASRTLISRRVHTSFMTSRSRDPRLFSRISFDDLKPQKVKRRIRNESIRLTQPPTTSHQPPATNHLVFHREPPCRRVCRGPGPLEVEAAEPSVHVQHLADD